MKKTMIIGICLLLLLVVVGIIILDNMKSAKILELTYKTNGGVPYEWQYVIDDDTIVSFVKSYEIDNQNDGTIVGAPIYINYVFKGLKEGVTTITFKYVSIVDGSVSKEEKNTIKVDKNNNISLVAYND